MTPESGLGGRFGGWIEGVCTGRRKVIGMGGTSGTSPLVCSVIALEGAVCGRLADRRSRSPPSPSLLGWMEGSLRRRFWIHCLAASCLPAVVEDVFWVLGVVILAIWEGAVCFEIGRWVMHDANGDAKEAVLRCTTVGKHDMASIVVMVAIVAI